MQVFSTRICERAIRKLPGEEARREMEESIIAAPNAAPVIRGAGGSRAAHVFREPGIASEKRKIT